MIPARFDAQFLNALMPSSPERRPRSDSPQRPFRWQRPTAMTHTHRPFRRRRRCYRRWTLLTGDNRIIASRLGAARPPVYTWNWTGAWLICSQPWQVDFSQTGSITFYWLRDVSSVSVSSSLGFRRRFQPQHARASGTPITARPRGNCSGKVCRAARVWVKP
jgi:hypothetical protein